ncbi:MAG: lipid-A-disaccharide synthase [Paramuribaculum sp.]|nr:lipid-A-disaccharide synthase [Paramuribaculum sp.]MDE6487983.1 lipid-A-disaccharide synthase [Paramuribaculum sp.]
MHYFLSAGEASGDLHAASLMEALRQTDPDARFTFLGGDLMAAAAGTKPVIDYRRMAFMGFSEVLRNLRTIAGNFSAARNALRSSGADALILVDYPSFNLKLARFAKKKLGIPVFYFIAPKVWAWKEWRVRDIRRYVDRVLSILPFETVFFAQHGIDSVYVGNPSREEVDERLAAAGNIESFLTAHNLPSGRQLLALVPGSRIGEIRNNLPVMDAVAKKYSSDFQPVIAAAPGIDPELYDSFSSFPRVNNDTFRLMHFSEAALVTSGTATLEAALAATPQVVCYRSNGSRLAYSIMRRILKIPFVSLPNLIAGREIIPEMLLHDCNPASVGERLAEILPGREGRQKQTDGYAELRQRLGDTPASHTAAQIITETLSNKK